MKSSRALTLALLMLSLLCFFSVPIFADAGQANQQGSSSTTLAADEDPGNSGPPHNDDSASGNPSHDDDWSRKDKPSNGNWGQGQHPNGPMSESGSLGLWAALYVVVVH